MWRRRGGVASAVAAIRAGTPAEALHAAKALGALAHDSGAEGALAEEGVVRAVLQLFNFKVPNINTQFALQTSLRDVVEVSPEAATQVLAAFADPDPWIAYAALYVFGICLDADTSRALVLRAGAARALVGALSHHCPDCRGMAAHCIFSISQADVAVLSALQAAGAVPALMKLVHYDTGSSHPSPNSGSFACLGLRNVMRTSYRGPRGGEVHVSFEDTGFIACFAVAALCDAYPGFVLEVVKVPRLPSAILSCLRRHDEEMALAPMSLLSFVLQKMENGPCMHATCQELVTEGFPALVPRLISLELPGLTTVAFYALSHVFETLGHNCIGFASAERIMALCEKLTPTAQLLPKGKLPTWQF